MAGFHWAMKAVAAGAGAAWDGADEARLAAASGLTTEAVPSRAARLMTSTSSSVAIWDEQSSSGITSAPSVVSHAD